MSRLDIKTPSKAQMVVEHLYRSMEHRIEASPPGLCPIDMALNFLNLCHAQTCGKCVPCRVGLGQLSDLLHEVLDGRPSLDILQLIEDTAEVIVASADCAIGVNAATFFGFRRGGIPGALMATVGLLVPSYFLVILALRSLKRWEKSFLVRGIMTGIHPATTGMILAALLIFMQMSVFSTEIPWKTWLGIAENASQTEFFIRPLAVLIFCAATALLYKGKVSIMSVIFGSAAVGALGAAVGLS